MGEIHGSLCVKCNFKGKYALELKNLALKQAGNSMWTDLIGWRNTAEGQNDASAEEPERAARFFLSITTL